MEKSREYLSLEEVADLLGVNYQLIYRLVRSGELPAIRLGRVYRVDRTDLDAYLESTKTSRGPVPATCSACGKTYPSSLSVSEACRDCGAPICQDCWTRRDVHRCREHEQGAPVSSER